ncbi:MAG: TolC family protein [Gammaproteobacteria bacterium]
MNNNQKLLAQNFIFPIALYFSLTGNVTALETHSIDKIYSSNHVFTNNYLSLGEALQFTLINQPAIQSKVYDIEFSKGELLVESGEFDSQIESTINRGENSENIFDTDDDDALITSTIERSFMDFRLDIQKRFRSGQTATLGYAVDYEDVEDSGTGASSEAEIFIELIQPLLKNRGVDASAAFERAAEIVIEAKEYDLRDGISLSLLDTVEAYWDYLAAKEILKVRQDATRVLDGLLPNLEDIDEEEIDSEDNAEFEAELNSRKSEIIEANQEYVVAKYTLGLAMGLASPQDIEAMPVPDEKFAHFNATDMATLNNLLPVYLRKPDKQRASILSLKRLQESASTLLQGARRNKEPQLDLIARYGYFGTEPESSFNSSFRSVKRNSGPVWLIGGEFSYPIGNRAAKGEIVQQKALLMELKLQVYDSLREISSSIMVTVKEIVHSQQEIALTEKSIANYEDSLQQLRIDFQEDVDLGDLLDLIDIQDDWVDARIDNIEQQARLTKAVAALVFETGEMLAPGPDYKINVDKLTTVP